MDGSLKNDIFTTVQPVLLSPLVDQLPGFGQVSALSMLNHFLPSYRAIDKIYLEENVVKMMETYDPAEPLARLIEKLEKRKEFASAGGQTISNTTMVSKGITLLAQTDIFNEDIIEWRRQTTNLDTWSTFKTVLHQSHREEKREVTTAGKETIINKIEFVTL